MFDTPITYMIYNISLANLLTIFYFMSVEKRMVLDIGNHLVKLANLAIVTNIVASILNDITQMNFVLFFTLVFYLMSMALLELVYIHRYETIQRLSKDTTERRLFAGQLMSRWDIGEERASELYETMNPFPHDILLREINRKSRLIGRTLTLEELKANIDYTIDNIHNNAMLLREKPPLYNNNNNKEFIKNNSEGATDTTDKKGLKECPFHKYMVATLPK